MIVEDIILLTGKEFAEIEIMMGLGFLMLENSIQRLNANYYGTLSLMQKIRNGVGL